MVRPDHLHTIVTLPQGDADFALRWHRIKTIFTQDVVAGGATFSPRDGGGQALLQWRFWEHTIRDDTDFSRHVDYNHHNPVKHGYVADPQGWPYSSLHRFIREEIVPPDWGKAVATPGRASSASLLSPSRSSIPHSRRENGLRLLKQSVYMNEIWTGLADPMVRGTNRILVDA